MNVLEDGFKDLLQFYAFKHMDFRKLFSTNSLERLNRRYVEELT